MGFFSWKCSKTGVSIPHDYVEEIILITPKGSYRGLYDGYGGITTEDKRIKILEQVAVDTALIRKAEELWEDGWRVTDTEGNQYDMRRDFEDFGQPIKDKEGKELFGGKCVNDLLEEGRLVRMDSTYNKVMKEVKLVVGYAYNGITDTFSSLKTAPSCEHQGYFYPEDFKNYPDGYNSGE